MPSLSTYLRTLLVSVVAIVLCILGLGLLYPAAVWAVSRINSESVEGDLVYSGSCLVASRQLDDGRAANNPDMWFVGRAEGMSNLGPSSPDLAESINQRRQEIAARENVPASSVPADAVTGSGSGADTGITPEYAALQIPRVARAHNMSEADVRKLVDEATHNRTWGILGERSVNVTELNLSLPGGADCPE